MSQPSMHDEQIANIVSSHWGDFTAKIAQLAGPLEAEYVQWRRRGRVASGVFYGGWIYFFFMLGDEDVHPIEWVFSAGTSLAIKLLVAVTLIGFLIAAYPLWRVMRRWREVNKRFNAVLNPLVYEKAFTSLGLTAQHRSVEAVGSTMVTDLLDHSELITEPHNRVALDDIVISEYDGRSLFFGELNAKHVTGSGKNRRTKKIFHGMFIAYDLPRSLEGKTFITTEGDRKGYGTKRGWWRRLFGKEEVRESLLEWNEFEDKLHVATSNETEARYILTTDLMQEVYDWWVERPGKIRISFIANRMYILFPDKDVKIAESTPSLQPEDLRRYVTQVVRPMWHVTELIEHVKRRFAGL